MFSNFSITTMTGNFGLAGAMPPVFS